MLQESHVSYYCCKKDMIILEKSEILGITSRKWGEVVSYDLYHHPLCILYSVFNVIIHYRSKV